MYRILVVAAGFGLILILGGCAPGRYGTYDRVRATGADSLALMTKEDVIKLSQAGLGDDVIIRMLDASGSTFRLKTKDVVELADSGVSDRVISEMMQVRERPKDDERSGGYFYYSPFYGFAMYPFWDPWYPSVYLGSWPWYYRPLYRHVYVPRFAGGFGDHGRRISGVARSAGRHR
jgi:hypothetical protein